MRTNPAEFFCCTDVLFRFLDLGKDQIMPWGGDGHNVQIYTKKTVPLCLGNRHNIIWQKVFLITFITLIFKALFIVKT